MSDVNVLLVEDNLVNQLVTTGVLHHMGIHVTVANHGREALEKITDKKFNLVLMDLQMPEMDGFESTTRIRAMNDPYFKQVPIIAFSAAFSSTSKAKADALGMTDFIDKPIRVDELKNKIKTYVYDYTRS